MTYPCPQCGHDTPEGSFSEGVCLDCCEANQDALNAFNAAYDWWCYLTESEREENIRDAFGWPAC